ADCLSPVRILQRLDDSVILAYTDKKLGLLTSNEIPEARLSGIPKTQFSQFSLLFAKPPIRILTSNDPDLRGFTDKRHSDILTEFAR
ncbi:MAG: hypothetical protein WA771_09215, partial [Chthoniobacterales bacterium]